MQGPTAKAQNVKKRQRDQLAAPLLKLVREAFEDPRTVAEFEEWKRRKEAAKRKEARA